MMRDHIIGLYFAHHLSTLRCSLRTLCRALACLRDGQLRYSTLRRCVYEVLCMSFLTEMKDTVAERVRVLIEFYVFGGQKIDGMINKVDMTKFM